MKYPVPLNEIDRLKALQEYNLLDSLPEAQFDRITKLAAIICDTPIALVSLIDKGRQWFKSNIGLNVNETAREISFCQYTITGEEFFEVEDATQDKRFKNNPLVLGYPKIRFYAAYPLIDPNGFALGSLCTIDNIPKKLSESQKEALKTLSEEIMLQIISRKKNEENRKLEKFFMMSNDMICVAGNDGYFKKINPAFTKALGWTEAELLERPFIEFVHPEDVKKTKLKIKKFSVENPTLDFINRYRTKDNSFRLFQWVAYPDPVTGEIFAIARDITEIDQVEQQLRKSEAFSSGVFNALTSNIAVIDEEGNIVKVNESWKQFAIKNGITSMVNNSIGSNYFKVCNSAAKAGDSLAAEVLIGIKEVLEGKKKIFQLEYPCHSPNKQQWFAMRVMKFKFEVPMVVIAHQDITERKIAEEVLLKSKTDADNSIAMQKLFLANMSHEIRTPMTAIVGFSSILKETGLNKKQIEVVSNINAASDNLLGIINDILDISKIEAGMLEIENTVVYLPALLGNLHSMMMGKALEKGLEFSLRINSDIPDYLICDPVRLSQILVNLVSNAIKFTNKGFVNIRAEISHNDTQNLWIKFTIQDSGIGIAKENREIIFERFKQESSDTTRKFGGTGLGLNIVKNLVRLIGGGLFVETEPGCGSEFTILIPFIECNYMQITTYKNQQHKAKGSYAEKPQQLNILLVEDNRMNQRYCSLLLADFGFLCAIANNGKEALEKMKAEKFDLILMDIQMPEMDGYEVSRIIRKELANDTPIIALTANAMADEQNKCLLSGMNSYMSKPFKPKDLYNKIIETYSEKSQRKAIHFSLDTAEFIETSKNLIDIPLILEQVQGNWKAVKELFEIFVEDTPRDMDTLKIAIANSDFKLIERTAHQLVSSFSILGINKGIQVLKSMESNASNQKESNRINNLYLQLLEITSQVKVQILEQHIES